jgi:hypothetical protein
MAGNWSEVKLLYFCGLADADVSPSSTQSSGRTSFRSQMLSAFRLNEQIHSEDGESLGETRGELPEGDVRVELRIRVRFGINTA